MTSPSVTITECDLQAYVDDQLDAAGRLEVADYLVRHPEAAARVLADLGNHAAGALEPRLNLLNLDADAVAAIKDERPRACAT